MVRVTTSGVMTDFPGIAPAFSVDRTGYVARGPDGAFWFGGDDGVAIGCCGYLVRVTALGAFTVYNENALPAGMTAGPDGAMWFVDRLNGAIARFVVPTTSPTSALPHIAAQDVWTTGIFAVNTGNAPANFEVDFHDDSGAPVALPFAGSATNKLTGMLPAQGSAYFETGNPGGPLISGSGQVTADAAVVVQSLFRENSSGLYYEAAVPSNVGSVEFLIPFDATTFAATGDPFFTGFAISNMDPLNPTPLACVGTQSDGYGDSERVHVDDGASDFAATGALGRVSVSRPDREARHDRLHRGYVGRRYRVAIHRHECVLIAAGNR